jgi:LysM repeat protein
VAAALISDLSNTSVYIIQPGNTLPMISAAAHVSIDELQRLNPELASTRLSVGQSIRLR